MAHTTSAPGRSVHFTKGHARGRGNTPQPITMVQCSGSSEKERWDIVFLCQLLLPKCMDKERFISTPKNPRSSGEYGRHGPFLFDGFQEQILTGENGARVAAVYHIHCRKPWFL